ncbi:MAG: hypothetical protein HY824_16975 [Acidobacteria bacterium]|nr:hypothetical protein [Acidobacteriota bacterium]
MLRRLIALGLTAAIQVGALYAPLVHAHLDDDHHGSHRVHAHASGHVTVHHHDAPGTTAVTPAEDADHVTQLQVFVAVHSDVFADPALPPARFSPPAVLDSLMRRPPEVVRSHGPPDGGPSGSRAPPASLS